jgi:hypothetical protein
LREVKVENDRLDLLAIPSRASEPIEDVMAKRMPLWYRRMLKVIIRRMRHPDTLHHPSGALVGWNGK